MTEIEAATLALKGVVESLDVSEAIKGSPVDSKVHQLATGFFEMYSTNIFSKEVEDSKDQCPKLYMLLDCIPEGDTRSRRKLIRYFNAVIAEERIEKNFIIESIQDYIHSRISNDDGDLPVYYEALSPVIEDAIIEVIKLYPEVLYWPEANDEPLISPLMKLLSIEKFGPVISSLIDAERNIQFSSEVQSYIHKRIFNAETNEYVQNLSPELKLGILGLIEFCPRVVYTREVNNKLLLFPLIELLNGEELVRVIGSLVNDEVNSQFVLDIQEYINEKRLDKDVEDQEDNREVLTPNDEDVILKIIRLCPRVVFLSEAYGDPLIFFLMNILSAKSFGALINCFETENGGNNFNALNSVEDLLKTEAIERGYLAKLKILIESNFAAFQADRYALICNAVCEDKNDILEYLLYLEVYDQEGELVPIDFIGENFHTPLFMFHNRDIARRLVAAGCPINYVNSDGYTALTYSISAGFFDEAHELLGLRASVEVEGAYNSNALLISLEFYNSELAQKVINIAKKTYKGTDLSAFFNRTNSHQDSSLHLATEMDDPRIFNLLIDDNRLLQLNFNAVNLLGHTVVEVAITKNYGARLNRFLDLEPNLIRRYLHGGRHLLNRAICSKSDSCVDLLVKYSEFISLVNGDLDPQALNLAAACNSEKVLDLVLNAYQKAFPQFTLKNLCFEDPYQLIHIAVANRAINCLKFLFEKIDSSLVTIDILRRFLNIIFSLNSIELLEVFLENTKPEIISQLEEDYIKRVVDVAITEERYVVFKFLNFSFEVIQHLEHFTYRRDVDISQLKHAFFDIKGYTVKKFEVIEPKLVNIDVDDAPITEEELKGSLREYLVSDDFKSRVNSESIRSETTLVESFNSYLDFIKSSSREDFLTFKKIVKWGLNCPIYTLKFHLLNNIVNNEIKNFKSLKLSYVFCYIYSVALGLTEEDFEVLSETELSQMINPPLKLTKKISNGNIQLTFQGLRANFLAVANNIYIKNLEVTGINIENRDAQYDPLQKIWMHLANFMPSFSHAEKLDALMPFALIDKGQCILPYFDACKHVYLHSLEDRITRIENPEVETSQVAAGPSSVVPAEVDSDNPAAVLQAKLEHAALEIRDRSIEQLLMPTQGAQLNTHADKNIRYLLSTHLNLNVDYDDEQFDAHGRQMIIIFLNQKYPELGELNDNQITHRLLFIFHKIFVDKLTQAFHEMFKEYLKSEPIVLSSKEKIQPTAVLANLYPTLIDKERRILIEGLKDGDNNNLIDKYVKSFVDLKELAIGLAKLQQELRICERSLANWHLRIRNIEKELSSQSSPLKSSEVKEAKTPIKRFENVEPKSPNNPKKRKRSESNADLYKEKDDLIDTINKFESKKIDLEGSIGDLKIKTENIEKYQEGELLGKDIKMKIAGAFIIHSKRATFFSEFIELNEETGVMEWTNLGTQSFVRLILNCC